MSLYYLILWNQVDIFQKHFKKDQVHMRLWTRFYGTHLPRANEITRGQAKINITCPCGASEIAHIFKLGTTEL